MWIIFALLTSLCNALYYICNQNVKLRPTMFMFYRGFAVAAIVVPFLLFYDAVTAWQFYAIALLQGLAICYYDLQCFKAYKAYGAETVSSITPIGVGVMFFLWLVLEPSTLGQYLQNPQRFIMIVLSLGGIIFAVMQYNKIKRGAKAVWFLMPVILFASCLNISNKVIMEYANGDLVGLSLWRVFITGIIIGVVNIFIYKKENRNFKQLTAKKNIKNLWLFLFLPVSMLLGNLAMYYAYNPAYVTSVMYVSVLWVMLINFVLRCRGCKLKHKPMQKKWVFLLLLSVIGLILLTN